MQADDKRIEKLVEALARMRLHYREIITMTAPDRDQERPQASTKPSWGLDEKSQKVWLEDGTSVR